MRRREFITLLGGAAAMAARSFPAFAQASSKRPLIVASVGGSKAGTEQYFGGFSQGMRELGYVEGRAITASTSATPTANTTSSPRRWASWSV